MRNSLARKAYIYDIGYARQAPAMVTKENVMQVLKNVKDPEIGASIVNLGMVKAVEVHGSTVRVDIALTVPNCPLRDAIRDDVIKAVSGIEGVARVDVQLSSMTDQERDRVSQTLRNRPTAEQSTVQQTWRSQATGIDKLPKGKIGQIIAVTSGKGGVGKSLVTALLAVELRRHDFSVGILDADLTGASIAKIFGVKDGPIQTPTGLAPPASRAGVKLVSMNLLMDRDDAALVWRGPMINSAIRQLYSDLEWGELDFLLVDLPPGTSDAPLTVFQSLPLDAVLIVSSPQDLAVTIVAKAINMAKIMNAPILGLIENMSHVTCPDCGRRIELFGKSKGQEASDAANIEFLGSIPVNPVISQLCDEGRIEEYKSPEFQAIAQRLIEKTRQLKVPQELKRTEKSTGRESGR
jgi:Mrp family chromosome partitioning ATPase